VKKIFVILLLASVLSNCTLLNSSQQLKSDDGPSTTVIGDYLVKYTSDYEVNKTRRVHPPATNYFILSVNTDGIKIPEKKDGLDDFIPYVLTFNDGYVWGDKGYLGDILGCCEFKDVKKGVHYVLEVNETDSLRMFYEAISSSIKKEMFDSVLSKYSYGKRNKLIEVSVCRIQGVFCKCPFYESESINFSIANDTLIYIKSLAQVNSLSPQEVDFFKELFQTINGL